MAAGGSPRASPRETWLFLSCAAHRLPLLSLAETREKKRGGAEEEGVGGSGAGEDSEQAQVLQRGPALLLSPPSLSHLHLKVARRELCASDDTEI